MACGCVPDVRGLLDQALDDRARLLSQIAELAEFISVSETTAPPPDREAATAAIAAGALARLSEAKPGGLAVYLDEFRAIAHVGRVEADGTVTSRWRDDLTCRHGLFDLPRRFGEMVHWYG